MVLAIDVDLEGTGSRYGSPAVVHGGVHQRLPIPKPNVVDGPAVVLERLKGEILFRGKRFSPRSCRGCRLPA